MQSLTIKVMKKIIASTLLIVVTFSLSCCQSLSGEKQESVLGPAIEFDATEHQFGIIERGGNGTFEFAFTNTGTEPLILSNVRSSCGCTVPSWPREPIPVGGKEVIKVKYNTNLLGQFSKTISVYSNAKDEPIILKIAGEVKEATTAATK